MGTAFSSVKYTPDGNLSFSLGYHILAHIPYYTLNDFKDLQSLDSGGCSTVFKGYSTVEKDGVRSKRFVSLSSLNFNLEQWL